MKQLGTRTRRTYRVNVREIAQALGIPLTPCQWVMIEDADEDTAPLTGHADIVVWEAVDA